METTVTIKSLNELFDDLKLTLSKDEINEILSDDYSINDKQPKEQKAQQKLKEKLKEKLEKQITSDSRDNKKSFKHTPFWFRATAFSLMLFNSLYLMSGIDSANNDEASKSGYDTARWIAYRAKAGFDGAGGFFFDLCNFFAEVTKLVVSFGDVKNKKRSMVFALLLMMFVFTPFLAWFYNLASKHFKETYKDYYLHFDVLLSTFNGFCLVALCVFSGLAFRYFTFKILEKTLDEKEYKESVDQSNWKVTKKEWLVRIVFGLSIGIIGSVLFPYLKPKILDALSSVLGKNHDFVEYTRLVCDGSMMLFGLHVACLRIIIPAIIKVLNTFFHDKNKQLRKARAIPCMVLFYLSAVSIFGLYAWFDKGKYLGNGTIPQISTCHAILFIAIGFNILGGMLIYKVMMLLVNEKKLCELLLSDNDGEFKRGQQELKKNKYIGIGFLVVSVLMITTVLSLFIYQRAKSAMEIRNVIENPFFIFIMTTIFAVVFFASIAIYGKSKFIEVNLGNHEIKKGLEGFANNLIGIIENQGFEKKELSKKRDSENAVEDDEKDTVNYNTKPPKLQRQTSVTEEEYKYNNVLFVVSTTEGANVKKEI